MWKADFKDAAGALSGKGNGTILVHEISDEALEDGLEMDYTMAKGTQVGHCHCRLGLPGPAVRAVSRLRLALPHAAFRPNDLQEIYNAVKKAAMKRVSELAAQFVQEMQVQLTEELSRTSSGPSAGGAAPAVAITKPGGVSSAEAAAKTAAASTARQKEEAARQEKRAAAAVVKAAAAAEQAAAKAAHAASMAENAAFAACVAGEWAGEAVWGLGGIGLADDDVASIVEAISGSEAAVELDLSNNAMTDAAAQKLCAML